MTYWDFKDLTGGTASDKILHDKAFNIGKNSKYDRYQGGLTSMVYKVFHKKTSGRDIKIENTSNKKIAEELHKPIIRNFFLKKVCLSLISNIWSGDVTDMQLKSKFNKGIRFLLCVIDIFSKCEWVILLEDKKVLQLLMLFKKC